MSEAMWHRPDDLPKTLAAGISTALDTLGSQAHGKGNFGAVLACCISAAGVMGLLCLPISVALWWSDTVARVAFRQKPAIASVSGWAVLPAGNS